MIKFTVIIPCYNAEKYLKNTINSVLDQDYKNFEILLVNDGSTDNTSVILNEFKSNVNIRIFEQENGGVSSARNLGLNNASGDYVFFLDADDLIEFNLFSILNKFLNDNGLMDMISFGYEILKSEKEKTAMYNEFYDNRRFSGTDFLNLFFTRKIKQCMCSFIVSRTLIESNKLRFNEKTFNGEDQEFQIKSIINSKEVIYLSQPFFKYVMRENSAVNSEFSEKYLSLIDVFIRLKKYLEIKGVKNMDLLHNFNRYSNLIFFYVLRKSIKSEKQTLIDKVIIKDHILEFNFPYKLDKQDIVLFFLRKLYFINPKLLTFIFKLN